METPRIEQIRGGFAAIGNGWAVAARTPSEAEQRYRAAERLHREIEARPDPTVRTADSTAPAQPSSR